MKCYFCNKVRGIKYKFWIDIEDEDGSRRLGDYKACKECGERIFDLMGSVMTEESVKREKKRAGWKE